ncbi:class I SAM-dependent methyltransferase [Trichocoleus sp. FACHB-90]|uniref:O-methyltransferase n=1 Tax=Cyanophyceae TaxID=3028117 RepID=UPI0016881293|nr:class I SAM-dependent methyltransferase [Trichocoleus sp. FACHB-90]MBD1926112.1 class I SAM-dependent methyltransferase [Trichocoleus sp. FACHB-90]
MSSLNELKARPVTPLGIAVEYLETAMRYLVSNASVSSQVTENLEKALRLVAGLDPYLEHCTNLESEALEAIADATRQEHWNKKFSDGSTVRALEQEMLSGHVEGQTLKMFVRMTRAKNVLDIGMFTGYSALAMAEALPSDGRLVACEVDAYVANFAQSLFRKSPHGDKIHVELGSALETLGKLAAAGESFDFAFIDADKKEYVQYYQMLLDFNLLSPDGFICVDNTLLQGQPYLPAQERSANGDAIAIFNDIVKNDPRVEQVLLPLRDGLTIIRRLPAA